MNSSSKSFEHQLGQYFKEDNVEVVNETFEDTLVTKELRRLEDIKKNKFNADFKKKRKVRNKRARASRKRNR
jgi:hypothetical protein|tara:strand:+ start:17359 stop:17574 length:216 start_codon:yes stop_codon:yes gene_type:complete